MDFDVAVLGSLHLDIMVAGGRLPRADETVMAKSWHFKCGGKGGNQAVAAAEAGARTVMAGRIGRDWFGEQLLANLKNNDVDCSVIAIDGEQGSGMSVAIDEPDGEYGAVVVSGANRCVSGDELATIAARVLVLQNEVPHPANELAARHFRGHGGLVIHNAAPATTQYVNDAGLIVVNRIEAQAMTDIAVTTLEDAERAATALRRDERDAIVTAGRLGYAIASRGGRTAIYPPPLVVSGSAHGAGDRFVGALAARLALGDDLAAAAGFAADTVATKLRGR